MLEELGREREWGGKRRRGGEEERREGQKSRGGQALGGGRAKSQEHYIIAGGKSKREGYESVYWLHLSPSLDGGQFPCVWSPQYLSWSWDLWRLGRYSVCLYVCVCGQAAGFVLCVRLSNSRGAHVEHWGPEESQRGLTRQWTVVSAPPLERNVAEHIRERERNTTVECKIRKQKDGGKVMSRRWGVVAVLGWRLWRSWAESKALSNVRVHGQGCGVSTCHPLGLAAQAIIKPLCGAACHYSKTQTHTHTHWYMHANYYEKHQSAKCVTELGRRV